MSELGLLEYHQRIRNDGGKGPNEYTFAGLVERLKPLAQEEKDRRRDKQGDINA